MRFLLAFLFALLLPLAASAQAFPGSEPLTLTLSPQYPRPYETVTVKVSSTAIDLATSEVAISVNGVIIEEGSGALSADARMGGPGSRAVIRATATENGLTYEAETTLAPSDVALVIEPVSSTHPWYEGAALVAPQGRVRIIAIPDLRASNGSRLAPETLSYTWKVGDRVLHEESGIGRSVLAAAAPVRYRDANVTVTVTNQAKTIIAQANTTIAPVDAALRMYRNDPLLGVLYDTAITDTATLSGTEETFRAVPYYFGIAPDIAWTVNGTASGTEEDVTVRVTGSGAGTANLSVSAKRPEALQSASESVRLRFGAARTGIFGF